MSRNKELARSVVLNVCRLKLAVCLLVLMSGSSPTLSLSATAEQRGSAGIDGDVVVEKIEPHGEAEKAGLKEGDILRSWSRGESKGEIQSPFDLSEIETEQSPLGPTSLEGVHGTEKQVWLLGPDTWGLTTRPNFGNQLLSDYRTAAQLVKTGNVTEIVKAADRWKELAKDCSNSQAAWLPTWLLFHAAESLKEAKQWGEADDAYQSALQSASGTGPVIEGQILRAWATAYQQRSDWANAEMYFQQAIKKKENTDGGKLTIAANLNALGKIWFLRGDLGKAERYYQQALEIERKGAPRSLVVALSLDGLGDEAYTQGNLPKAEAYFRRALKLRERLAPESLIVAHSLNNLAAVACQQSDKSDLDKAEEYCRQSLQTSKKLAPGNFEETRSLMCLGSIAWERGDMVASDTYDRQALEIEKTRASQSEFVAQILTNLGSSAREYGDLAKAEQYHREALEIAEGLGSEKLLVADILRSLGTLFDYRGDIAKAEQYNLRALHIRQKLAPGSLYVSRSLNNLGVLAWQHGDLARAEQYHRRALAINQKLAPGSLDVALSFTNLGYLARQRADLVKAGQYHQEALLIRRKVAPGRVVVAASLGDIGIVAYQRGYLRKAEQCYLEALALQRKLAPESIQTSVTLQSLGDAIRKSGSPRKAERYYHQALAIREKLAPGSQEQAESLAAIASVLRDQGQLDTAGQYYERAVRAFENQTARLGGSEEVRSGFRANHSDIYRKYVDLLLEQNQPAQAFEVLERSRTRILLEMLMAAHIDIRKGAGASLLEQEHSLRELLAAKSDRRLRLLGERDKEKQIAAFSRQIEELEKQYQDVEEQLRLTSPSYAALTQPQPLSVTEIQQLLDADTVLLEYSLGEKRSHVFVVTPTSVNVHELPKQAEIDSAAKGFYKYLSSRNSAIPCETRSQRQSRERKAAIGSAEAAAKLGQMILAPVTGQIQGKRLLIVSDGALQYIPFAALPSPESGIGSKVPLIAKHEIVNVPSASILAVLRREVSTRKLAPKAVIIVADPVFDSHDDRLHGALKTANTVAVSANSDEITDQPSLDRSAREVGAARDGIFARLPFSRREAEAIYAMATQGDVAKALDFDASKATAMSKELGDYRIVHFATHGLVNSEHPALSGLVFSLLDRQGRNQDGFLRLSDIYNLELNADLVVLSACQTALGKQINGEGLIGITRGFMYAGSPRVIASLWNADDEATAELMKKLYEGVLKNGQRPAEALWAAQMWMLQQTRWKAPYYWAGFILQGEWR